MLSSVVNLNRAFVMFLSAVLMLAATPFFLVPVRADPVCTTFQAPTPEMQAYVDKLCHVQSTLFGDSADPSSGYETTERPSKPGTIELFDAYHRSVNLVMVSVMPVNVRKLNPEAFDEGDECACVWGHLDGPAGRVPVVVCSISKPSAMLGSQGSYIYVVEITSNEDIDRMSQTDRLRAGPRIVNSISGKSVPLSSLSGGLTCSIDASDLSTAYSADTSSQQGDASVECMNIAYKRWNANEDAARKSLEVCLASANKICNWCAAACLGSLLMGPHIVTLITLAVCEAVCFINLDLSVKACYETYRIASKNALDNCLLDLESCGVHTLQT